MSVYKAIEGQSLWDVCLNTYGSFDYMVKLLQDNDIDNINVYPYSGQPFNWDETLVVDQLVTINSQSANIIYATKAIKNGSILSVVQNASNTGQAVAGGPADNYFQPDNPNPETMVKYQQTGEVQYIAAGGESSMTPVDDDGNAVLKDSEIIQITKEIKPLYKADFSLNVNDGMITLNNGIVMGPGETLFIIFGKIITS